MIQPAQLVTTNQITALPAVTDWSSLKTHVTANVLTTIQAIKEPVKSVATIVFNVNRFQLIARNALGIRSYLRLLVEVDRVMLGVW